MCIISKGYLLLIEDQHLSRVMQVQIVLLVTNGMGRDKDYCLSILRWRLVQISSYWADPWFVPWLLQTLGWPLTVGRGLWCYHTVIMKLILGESSHEKFQTGFKLTSTGVHLEWANFLCIHIDISNQFEFISSGRKHTSVF